MEKRQMIEKCLHTWILEISYIQYTLKHILPLALLAQVEPRYESLAKATISGSLAGEVEVAGIGGEDSILGFGESGVDGFKGLVAG